METNNTLQEQAKKLRKMRRRQRIASLLGIAVLVWGVVQAAFLFLDYKNTETSNDAQVGEELEHSAECAALRAAVSRLPARERTIMEMRFGLGGRQEHTQKEVADSIGISQSYISRLEKRIIKRLRREMETVV